MRRWLFKSTNLFWLLFPLALAPLVVRSTGIRYWCGFGLGQPWEWVYYCGGHGVTSYSVMALFGDFAIGLTGLILVWQLIEHSIQPVRYIVGVIGFLLVWFVVAVVVGFIVTVYVAPPDGDVTRPGIGLDWPDWPGTILGLLAGIQSFRASIRDPKQKDGSK